MVRPQSLALYRLHGAVLAWLLVVGGISSPIRALQPGDENAETAAADPAAPPDESGDSGEESAGSAAPEDAAPAAVDDGEPPAVAAPGGDDPAPTGPEQIIQDQPSFLVKVDVDRPDRRYREGESLRATIVSEEDAYAYVLYQQADGQTFQIFPNSVQQDNRIAAGAKIEIPASDDQFRWRIGAPFGKEVLKVVATKEPLDELGDAALLKGRFNVVDRARLGRATKSLKGDGDSPPVAWAEDQVEITTLPRDAGEAAPGARRFGVFFGVSEYKFNDAAVALSDDERGLNVASPAAAARAMQALMQSLGKLNDSRIYLNEQATRAQMEQAITGWLPSVSRPGDEVFIFFSGHGGQILDDQKDEPDGLDEVLLTHDYVDAAIIAGMVKLQQQGQLDPSLEAFVAQGVEVIKRAGSIEAGDAALARAAGVSDDLFGHWVQRLAGRRVVVILDCCHSGGQATGKSIERPATVASFDFLAGEAGRLKDLGQPDCSLLAACGAQETTMAFRISDEQLNEFRAASKGSVEKWKHDAHLPLLTYYVAESLLARDRPLNLKQIHEHCRAGMKQYLASLDEIQRQQGEEPVKFYEPVFVDDGSPAPIAVKP